MATAVSGRLAGAKKIVCIVSGGNIDPAVLSRILVGETAVNVDAVRERFSSLQSGFAFFDAPGGTQVPDEVGQAIANALREASGQPRSAVCDRPRRRGDPRAREVRRGALPRLARPTRSRSG